MTDRTAQAAQQGVRLVGWTPEGEIQSDTFRLRRWSGAGTFEASDPWETILAAPSGGVTLLSPDEVELPTRSVAILPAGPVKARLAAGVSAYLLSPVARPEGIFRRRSRAGRVAVLHVGTLPTMPGNPRLRLIQSEVMSINWTEYDGPRDRRTLSPHLHDDFGQGALALEGQFIHHLRLPWGPDATSWMPDQHIEAGPETFVEIPPGHLHTTEGIGDDHHLVIEMFSPPRADFIAKGWVANAGDYEAAGQHDD
ncbi:hypothetical protein [Pseudoroseicyclus sp. CXY001]|uniref:hypothetical protein n=1 Tax=Pseudoroseicyclus sp. CXY001 TaxID=3242492 RepID=UPI00358DC4F8